MNIESMRPEQLILLVVLSLAFLVFTSLVLIRLFIKSQKKIEVNFPVTPSNNSTSNKSVQAVSLEPDSGLILHKIKKLIEQIDLSLLVNEKEYSNKLYLQARDLYSNKNLNGEDKAAVRDDLLRIHKALYKD